MGAVADLDEAIDRYELAIGEFYWGSPEPTKELWSHREDASLANPLGPPALGWDEVARTIERAASNLGDGGMVEFEDLAKYVTPGLAYTVCLERAEAKVGGRGMSPRSPFGLR